MGSWIIRYAVQDLKMEAKRQVFQLISGSEHRLSRHGQFQEVTVLYDVWTWQQTPTLRLKRCPDINMAVRKQAVPKKPFLLRSLVIDADTSSWVWEMSEHRHRCLGTNSSRIFTVPWTVRTFIQTQTFCLPTVWKPRKDIWTWKAIRVKNPSCVRTSHLPVQKPPRRKHFLYLKPALPQLSTSLKHTICRDSIERIDKQVPRTSCDTTQGSWLLSQDFVCVKTLGLGFKPSWCDCIIEGTNEFYRWGSLRS